jgi:hypothetical protein
MLLLFAGKLFADDAADIREETDYYAKKRINGMIFTAAGGTSFIAGTILFTINVPRMHTYETGNSMGVVWETPDGLVGLLFGLSGAVCTIVGVTKWVQGSSNLKYYKGELKAPDRGMHLELDPSGVRLVLDF